MPGLFRKNNHRLSPATAVPSGLNRVLIANYQPHHHRSNTLRKEHVLEYVAVAGTDWPVSPPLSTPPPQTGGAGYWTAFAA